MARPADVSLAGIALDPASPVPLYAQLYGALRAAIVARHLPGGARLPSTRMLAATLHLSRHTVLTAVEQLVAEGYLEGRHGAGTYIAPEAHLPADMAKP